MQPAAANKSCLVAKRLPNPAPWLIWGYPLGFPRFFRIEAPRISMRCALWTSQSTTPSAKVGSPICWWQREPRALEVVPEEPVPIIFNFLALKTKALSPSPPNAPIRSCKVGPDEPRHARTRPLKPRAKPLAGPLFHTGAEKPRTQF
jgi:hypothetical protein